MARFTRPMTLGARVAAFDGQNCVYLVKHSYVPGWHLPGGGVEPGETLEEAARREVREETGLDLAAPLTLHGLFFNRQASRRDHVAVFVARNAGAPPPAADGFEISARGFFSLEALPPDTAGATHRRLAEIVHGQPLSSDW